MSRLLPIVALMLVSSAAGAEESAASLVERAYAVADLVVPIRLSLPSDKFDQQTLEGQLMSTLRDSVAPASWEEKGGPGSMRYFAQGMSLVVRQTPEIHARIEALLAELRRPQDVQVALELRIMAVSEAMLATFMAEVDVPRGEQVFAYLNDDQMRRLFEFAQGNPQTQLMQMPKITLFNGQLGNMNVTEQHRFTTDVEMHKTKDVVIVRPKVETIETGIKYQVRPVVSADRKTIDVAFNLTRSQLDSPVAIYPLTLSVEDVEGKTQKPVAPIFLQQPKVSTLNIERVLKLADGQTALVHAGTMITDPVRHEYGPPVLSRIPYVSRLFKNVGYGREAQRLLVSITPRVIVNESSEQARR